MAAGFSRWPMLKNSDFWISRFDIWLQHGLLHRPRLNNYSNRTNIDTFRAKSVWRPFCFFTWLTCFFEKVHAKEHSCQMWCLYHKVKYCPLFFKLAAPLTRTRTHTPMLNHTTFPCSSSHDSQHTLITVSISSDYARHWLHKLIMERPRQAMPRIRTTLSPRPIAFVSAMSKGMELLMLGKTYNKFGLKNESCNRHDFV